MLVVPLQERMDDWKKVAVQLDKEHNKGIYVKYYFHLALRRDGQPPLIKGVKP